MRQGSALVGCPADHRSGHRRCLGRTTRSGLALALLLALQSTAVLSARLNPSDIAKPDYSVYHTKEETFERMRALVEAHPNIMKIDNFTHANDNYASTLTAITVDPAGLGRDELDNKIRLLLNFGEHGRELITVEVALLLLEMLADPAKLQKLPWLAGKPLQPLLELLHKCVFKIVPMENINGRDKVERGELCERKNGRGVDPNRNWDLHWGFKEKDYDPNEEFPGKHPFSEPEAVLIRLLAEEFRPHVWLNVHSGMEALFMPYDHQPHVPEGEAAAASLRILEALNVLACDKRCAVGSGGKSVGYLAHGTATDYMYEVLKVPMSFTWEIYGDDAAPYEDCFRMFNPIGRKHVREVAERWVTAILMLVELLPSHPSVPQVEWHDHRGLTMQQVVGGGAAKGSGQGEGRGVGGALLPLAEPEGHGGAQGSARLVEWLRRRHATPIGGGGERGEGAGLVAPASARWALAAMAATNTTLLLLFASVAGLALLGVAARYGMPAVRKPARTKPVRTGLRMAS